MMLAYELKVPLNDVMEMDPELYVKWLAFFKIKAKNEKDAADKASKGARRRRT